MNYIHLTIEERACIAKFKEINMSLREMAKILDRNVSTISRELKRNSYKTSVKHSVTRYSPTLAQNKYSKRRLKCHRPTTTSQITIEYIKSKIQLHWSPDQIINRKDEAKPVNFPSLSTIYRWIHLGYIPKTNIEHLRRKGKFKRPAEKRGKFNIGNTIKKRPKEVYKRNTFGHWEADTVVSGKINNYTLKSKYCFVSLAERKTRLYLVKLIPNRKEETVTNAIIELLKDLPKGAVKTITCDRGKEFAGWKRIEEELNTKHLKSYLMSIYVNVALDLTNYPPKNSFLLYLGTNTMWHLQFHFVCDKLCVSFNEFLITPLFDFVLQLTDYNYIISNREVFMFVYHR